jgi:50S ribosomal subunit-associated GTPase HflX
VPTNGILFLYSFRATIFSASFTYLSLAFICCFDVSAVPQRTLESQVDFVVHLLNSAMKNKKPVVLVTTKNDDLQEETNTSICTCLNKRCFSAIESYFS